MQKLKKISYRVKKAFTLVEILVALLVVAALAGGTIFIISRININAVDVQKTDNAKELTKNANLLWQANIDITGWGTGTKIDSTAAIAALQAGYVIPPMIEGGQTTPVKLMTNPNPLAYFYTAPAGGDGPKFDPIMGKSDVRP